MKIREQRKYTYLIPHNLFLFLSLLSFSSENTQWNGLKTTFRSDFQNIIGTILVTRNPLSDVAIDTLLCLEQPSAHTISHLGCVFQWTLKKPVHTLHPSFADFLTLSLRYQNTWFISTAVHNCHDVIWCSSVYTVLTRS